MILCQWKQNPKILSCSPSAYCVLSINYRDSTLPTHIPFHICLQVPYFLETLSYYVSYSTQIAPVSFRLHISSNPCQNSKFQFRLRWDPYCISNSSMTVPFSPNLHKIWLHPRGSQGLWSSELLNTNLCSCPENASNSFIFKTKAQVPFGLPYE